MSSNPRLTQSPRSLRDSTENAGRYAKGEVQTDMGSTSPRRDPINDVAWEHLGKGGDQLYDVGR